MNDSEIFNMAPEEVIVWDANGPVSSSSAQKSLSDGNTTLPRSLPFPLTEPFLDSQPSGPFIWEKDVFYKKHKQFIDRVCKGLRLLGKLYYVDKNHRMKGGERGDIILRRFFKAVAKPGTEFATLSPNPTRECVAVEEVEKLLKVLRKDLSDETTDLIHRHCTTTRLFAKIHSASGEMGIASGEFLDDYAKMYGRLNQKIAENIKPTPTRAAIAKRNKLLGLPLRLY